MARTISTFSCDIARRSIPARLPSANGGAELNRHVEKVVRYLPLRDMARDQRRESHEALLDADGFEHLPGKWQAAIVRAGQNRPHLRIVRSDARPDQ